MGLREEQGNPTAHQPVMKTRNILAIVLLAVGMSQMTGYLTGNRLLRGVGLASGVSPFTKVFCEADGYEAFAASFRLEGRLADGTRWTREFDPEWYSQLRGPYNRRNVYGASLAFAPRLPEKLRDHLLGKALSPTSRMRRELNIPEDLHDETIIITPRAGERQGPWNFTPDQP